MWNNKIEGRKRTPGEMKITGFLCIILGLIYAIREVWSYPNLDFKHLFFAITLLFGGPYILSTYKRYKEDYYPDRRFSQPVSPDGSPIEDNSTELNKQILEEVQKTKGYSRKDFFVSSTTLVVGSVLFALLIIIFSTNITDRGLSLLAIPTFFFGLSVIVTLCVFRKKKGNLKLRIYLVFLFLVSELIILTIVFQNFLKRESVTIFVIAVIMLVSVFLVYRMIRFSLNEPD